VGDHFITDICWYGPFWEIKGDCDGIADRQLYEDELKMVRYNSYGEAVERVFALANIEYGRLDFGLVDGNPCVYEINTNPMLFGPPRSHPIPERVESRKLKWSKLVTAFEAIDTASNASQELVDVAGTSIEALTEANAIFPALRFHHLTLSREHERRGNLSAALSSAEASVAANPTSVEALSHLSRILTKQNRTDDAIAISERAVALNPRHIGERHNLASLLMEAGRQSDARDQLLETLASSKERWKTYLLLSRACIRLGDHSGALRAVRSAFNESSVAEWQQRLTSKLVRFTYSALKRWQEHFARSSW
jgi:tetratricopeptide (TPR) repeat protein